MQDSSKARSNLYETHILASARTETLTARAVVAVVLVVGEERVEAPSLSAHLHPYSHLHNPSHPPWHATTTRFFLLFFRLMLRQQRLHSRCLFRLTPGWESTEQRSGRWARSATSRSVAWEHHETGRWEWTFKCSGRGSFDCTSYITEPKLIGRFYCCISSKSSSEFAAVACQEQGGTGRGGEARREAGSERRAVGRRRQLEFASRYGGRQRQTLQRFLGIVSVYSQQQSLFIHMAQCCSFSGNLNWSVHLLS